MQNNFAVFIRFCIIYCICIALIVFSYFLKKNVRIKNIQQLFFFVKNSIGLTNNQYNLFLKITFKFVYFTTLRNITFYLQTSKQNDIIFFCKIWLRSLKNLLLYHIMKSLARKLEMSKSDILLRLQTRTRMIRFLCQIEIVLSLFDIKLHYQLFSAFR